MCARVNLERHGGQRRRLSLGTVEERPEEVHQCGVRKRKCANRAGGIAKRRDGLPGLHDFVACELLAADAFEQHDPAAPGDGVGEVGVLRCRSRDSEKDVHDDGRDPPHGEAAHHGCVYMAREWPQVLVQAELIGRGLVDADDEDVRRRGDGPSHPEQPGESPIVFQRDAGGTERQSHADCGDEQPECDDSAKAGHGSHVEFSVQQSEARLKIGLWIYRFDHIVCP